MTIEKTAIFNDQATISEKREENLRAVFMLLAEQEEAETRPEYHSQNAYEANFTAENRKREYEGIKDLIQSGNIYQPSLLFEGGISGASWNLHNWLASKLPRAADDLKERSAEGERLVKILRLMEELYPPTLQYFVENNDIFTKIKETFPLNDEVDVSVEVTNIQPKIYKKQFAKLGKQPGDNELYEVKINLVDHDGKVLHNFNDDLPRGGKITPGVKWSADSEDLKSISFDAISGNFIRTFAIEGILALGHEIGHIKQFHDQNHLERFRNHRKGRTLIHGDQGDPLIEANAWKNGLKLLRDIERQSGKRVLPPKKAISLEVRRCLSGHYQARKARLSGII